MKRDKKAILNTIEKLISKYGARKVRLEINCYFKFKLEKEKTTNLIKEKEQELKKLKRKIES